LAVTVSGAGVTVSTPPASVIGVVAATPPVAVMACVPAVAAAPVAVESITPLITA